MLFTLKDILKLYNVRAKKNLSQNFIFDHGFLKRIAAMPSTKIPTDNSTAVIEIGPAAGNLSRALLGRGFQNITLVEKDERFRPILAQLQEYSQGKLRVFFDDALNLNSDWLESPQSTASQLNNLLITGNLPFAVATPLTLKLFEAFDTPQSSFFPAQLNAVDFVFMFQYEVALKFTAKPGTNGFGRLAVLAQTFADCRLVEKVSRHKFTPQPLVDAGIVHFRMKPEMRGTQIFKKMENLTAQAFRHKNQRNKIFLDGQRPVHVPPEHWLQLSKLR